MGNWAKTCSVCLKTTEDLKQLTLTDGKNVSLLSKLRSCVPEIDWKDEFLLCVPCNVDLDLVYEFREKCISSDTVRAQEVVASEIVVPQKISKKPLLFTCEQCNEGFATSTQIISHFLKEHNVENYKPFFCHICTNRFRRSSNLMQHLKYHDGNRTHVCSFCGKGYITRNDLSIHEKIHLNKKEYKCEGCSKSFNTHKDLRSHKLVVHTDSSLWPHVCEVCSKRFPIKSNFDAHMRRHNNERPFACHLCDKRFIDKCVLQKHILRHSNFKAFVCEVCKKEYKDERVMNIHKKKIHGIGDVKLPERVKKFLCHLCAKSYFDKNKLTRHLLSHSNERPLLCPKKSADKFKMMKMNENKKTEGEEEEIPRRNSQKS